MRISTEPKKQKLKDLFQPIQCPHCNSTNTHNAKFCIKCFYPLSKEALSEFDTVRMLLKEMPVERIAKIFSVARALDKSGNSKTRENE